MKLYDTLTFQKATLPGLRVKIHELQPKVTLVLETELTAATAKVIGCHDTAFDGQDNPRAGFDKIELPYEIEACQIKLASQREAGMSLLITPQTVEKFQVLRNGDAALGLRFAVLTDRAKDAIDFLLENAGMEFGLEVTPSQAELDFSGDKSQADQPIGQDQDFLKELGIGDEDQEEQADGQSA